jgi:hypothetical protein
MRLGVILDPDSGFAQLWGTVKTAILTLQSGPACLERGLLVCIGGLIYAAFSGQRLAEATWEYNPGSLPILWKELVREAQENGVLKRHGLSLPLDMRDIRGKEDKWFDATEYWLDWNK